MYLYAELGNARPAWLAFSAEERQQYFDEDSTPHRAGYRYLAVWKRPGPEQVEMLERSVAPAGWQ